MQIDSHKIGIICYTIVLIAAIIMKPNVILNSAGSFVLACGPILGITGHSIYKHRKDQSLQIKKK